MANINITFPDGNKKEFEKLKVRLPEVKEQNKEGKKKT